MTAKELKAVLQGEGSAMYELLTRIDNKMDEQAMRTAIIETKLDAINSTHEAHDRKLDDHEARIRVVEQFKASTAGTFNGMGLGARIALILAGCGGVGGLAAFFKSLGRM